MGALTPVEIEALLLSLKVGLLSVAICLPLGLCIAVILARLEFPGKWLVDGIVHLPLVLPPVVIGYLLLVLLGRRGLIGAWLLETFDFTLAFTWKGAAVAAAVMALPLTVRAIRLSLEQLDQGLEIAAKTLGASWFRVFWTITVPLCLPGILTGTILAFARSLGEFGATITFVSNIPGATQTLPLALFTETQVPGDPIPAIRLTVIAVAVALMALITSEYLARRIARQVGTDDKSGR
ncbi:MAG: molybdate ABC transporter permease subunit [Alphaproteobacteria bacterium]|nr:molybdate ABC transporter permease subunit [Alphaproteobacteria bacterium]